jgi:hypothetical protein
MLEICDVDVTDEAQLREWYDVWRAGQRHPPAGADPVVGVGPRPAGDAQDGLRDGPRINEAMGYRQLETLVEYHERL